MLPKPKTFDNPNPEHLTETCVSITTKQINLPGVAIQSVELS